MIQNDYIIDESRKVVCFHCGESCKNGIIKFDSRTFCCEGCKLVYDLLKENSLCTYYNLNKAPGSSPVKPIYTGKYEHLNNPDLIQKLIQFTDGQHTHITFYIPGIHCSSCIWLLENLHRLNKEVISCSVNFIRKEASITYRTGHIKLSEIVELLAHIGYEPLINLNDLESKAGKPVNKTQVIKIGLAGFCFGNIMMLSFPEYFSLGNFHEQKNLNYFFGYLNLFLSLPVFFFCASDFFISAWKSVRHRYLNIDTPIAMAILVTFLRSIYEITSHTGAGYMDSMTGIVFFMLIGRYFQNRTYETLSFERDYKSFFPIGVTVLDKNGKETNRPVTELKKGDCIKIRNNELIPADAVLLNRYTHIDYSFITGESAPIKKQAGELVYAGGKQLDGAIELEVINPTSQSYLTKLWNKDKQEKSNTEKYTFAEKVNKYFTMAVLLIASLSAFYWLLIDPAKALNAFTAVLIVACPCGLLLTTTFANGNILRIMGRNKFYLKNSGVIEKLARTDTVLFDKTGTITHGSSATFIGVALSTCQLKLITSLAAQSSHPLSQKIYTEFSNGNPFYVTGFEEIPGKGIKGSVEGNYIIMGAEHFVTGANQPGDPVSTKVFVMLNGNVAGYFSFVNTYRKGLKDIVDKLLKKNYSLKVLSGDNSAEKPTVENFFGKKADIFFNLKPEDKMDHVKLLQSKHKNVMMIGDGLNDAGALTASDVGIAISDDTNNFSPACDAILDGSSFRLLPDFIDLAKANQKVIMTTFIISLAYNIIGLLFAVQGMLSPVIAAILMPSSSISIVLLTTLSTTLLAKRRGL